MPLVTAWVLRKVVGRQFSVLAVDAQLARNLADVVPRPSVALRRQLGAILAVLLGDLCVLVVALFRAKSAIN